MFTYSTFRLSTNFIEMGRVPGTPLWSANVWGCICDLVKRHSIHSILVSVRVFWNFLYELCVRLILGGESCPRTFYQIPQRPALTVRSRICKLAGTQPGATSEVPFLSFSEENFNQNFSEFWHINLAKWHTKSRIFLVGSPELQHHAAEIRIMTPGNIKITRK